MSKRRLLVIDDDLSVRQFLTQHATAGRLFGSNGSAVPMASR